MKYVVIACLFFSIPSIGQKEIYIPWDWQQGNLDYSFDRSAESENFIIFWGPLAGDDPIQAPAEIAFDPQAILDTAEVLYTFYIDTIRFVNDSAGLISQYKIILVMLHTWTGLEGWAFGGNYDGVVGAMWMHPHAAGSGPTLAHEFTHTLQNYTWMMNPGHGFIDSSYVGFFWETHAEFMALQRYPSVALQFDMARWLNTCHFHWSSTRHHYQAFIFLQFLKERDGIGMINRLWNEAIIGEHPLQTYMRLKDIDQDALNDLFAEYAMRNVTWDYAIGDLLRERIATLPTVFVSHPTFIPEAVDTARGWYRIQNHLAPQDYGYNIIRLYPDTMEGCDHRAVHIQWHMQTIYPDYDQAGLRYGLVAVNQAGQPRYSEIYDRNNEIVFELMPDEPEVYLVVTGAPTEHHNYAWEIGFPKIYRFPYDFRVKHARPEGFQSNFRKPDSGIAGAPHINGGGFVANTAVVVPSAYVGPNAQVLGSARVVGNARIEDQAIVQHNALVENNAVVSGQAIVGETAHVFGNATVTGQAHVFGSSEIYGNAHIEGNSLLFHAGVYENAHLKDNTFCWGAILHGDVVLGGDAEFFSECADGTYLQVEYAYDRNCDGLDDHPANEDVTERFFVIDNLLNEYTWICGSLHQNIFQLIDIFLCEGDTFYFNGITITETFSHDFEFEAASGVDSIISLWVEFLHNPSFGLTQSICPGDTIWISGTPFTPDGPDSVYVDSLGCGFWVFNHLVEFEVDTFLYNHGHFLEVLYPALYIQWYDCQTNLPIDGAEGKLFTPSESGYYKARILTLDGCDVFSGCHYVAVVGNKDISFHSDWAVHPNPASDFIELQINFQNQTPISIEIYDALGKQVLFNNNILATSTTIPVHAFSSGTYFIKLSAGDFSVSTKKFVKL